MRKFNRFDATSINFALRDFGIGTADGETAGEVRAKSRATRHAGSVWGTFHFTTKPRRTRNPSNCNKGRIGQSLSEARAGGTL